MEVMGCSSSSPSASRGDAPRDDVEGRRRRGKRDPWAWLGPSAHGPRARLERERRLRQLLADERLQPLELGRRQACEVVGGRAYAELEGLPVVVEGRMLDRN